jgi:serine/threonine-protein kinase
MRARERRRPPPTWKAAAGALDGGLEHRDLKPSNIMLVADPHTQIGERTKLLDFGLAKLTGQKGGLQVRTQSNVVMGTPLYMSPEQCEGPGRVDVKTDVYSLGAIFYEMLAGRQPFLGESLGQVIAMHMFKEPEPLSNLAPEVPAVLAALVHRMLAKRTRARASAHRLCALPTPRGTPRAGMRWTSYISGDHPPRPGPRLVRERAAAVAASASLRW